MKLRLNYMAQLGTAIGRADETVDVPSGSRLSDLLVHLAGRYGEARDHLITTAGDLVPSLLIVVNDTAIPARQVDETVLHDGDAVSLLPPIAGG